MNENSNQNEICHRALQIQEVLEHVFKFCSAEDLRACRQVSTLWNKSSLKRWSSISVVKLATPRKMTAFLEFVLRTGAKHLYCNYILRGSYPNDICEPFWLSVGSSISTLVLGNCGFESPEYLRRVIYDWTPNLEKVVLRNDWHEPISEGTSNWSVGVVYYKKPRTSKERIFTENCNLKSLSIHQLNYFPIPFMELFPQFPGLKVLNLNGYSGSQEDVFRSLVNIRRSHPEKLNLSEIVGIRRATSTNRDIGPHTLEALVDTGLQLQLLSIVVSTKSSVSQLGTIIGANHISLRQLYLASSLSESYHVPINIKLINLTHLTVNQKLLASYEFLTFTPNLVTLSIVDNRDETRQRRTLPQLHSEEFQRIRMTRLMELKSSSKLSVQELNQFKTLFPNVERLTVKLDNDTFRWICEHWTNLTLLELASGSSVDECGITGMSSEDVDMINIERILPCTVRRQNLTYMTNLRHLNMTANPELNISLDYCGIMFGVKQLPNLITFNTKDYAYHITEHLYDDLRKQLNWKLDIHSTAGYLQNNSPDISDCETEIDSDSDSEIDSHSEIDSD